MQGDAHELILPSVHLALPLALLLLEAGHDAQPPRASTARFEGRVFDQLILDHLMREAINGSIRGDQRSSRGDQRSSRGHHEVIKR